MKTPRKAILAVYVLVAVVASSAVALAGPITSVIVYGDSLSDNGNLFGTIAYPPAPYYNGRFSNGPVTVEKLAAKLGVPLFDFAWGGATTGLGNSADGGTQISSGALGLPGMLVEFSSTEGTVAPLASSALFVVWGGPNDIWYPPPLQTPLEIMARSVNNLVTIVDGLRGLGATRILVPGMPDLGLTPDAVSAGQVAESTAYAMGFNAMLQASLPPGVTYFDTFLFLHELVANPAAYGFTNVTTPCFDGISVCADPNTYLFWDGVHPTTATDELLASSFASAVPEPGTMLLLCTGLGVIALGARRRR